MKKLIILDFLCSVVSVFGSKFHHNNFLWQKYQSKRINATSFVGGESLISDGHTVRQPRTRDYFPRQQALLWMTPFLATLAGFAGYNQLSLSFHALMQEVSTGVTRSYVPKTTEEINLQTQVITQVINGPVITSVSVLFATLVSTTISTLHKRQMEILRSLTRQLEGLQILEMISQDQTINAHLSALKLLYVQQDNAVNNWTEIDAVLSHMLRRLQKSRHAEAYTIVKDMHQERSQQRVSLQPAFPGIHYLTLSILAFSISLSFLIAIDQSMSILGSLQCRILWSILIGAFTSLGVLCYDLSSPFMGAYQVRDFIGNPRPHATTYSII